MFAHSRANRTEWPVVFYHFHALRFLSADQVDLGTYKLRSDVLDSIYQPYLKVLAEKNRYLLKFGIKLPVQKYGTKKRIPIVLHKILRRLLGVYNIVSLSKLGIK